jgi:phage shock protein A
VKKPQASILTPSKLTVKQLLIKLAALFGMVSARRHESVVKQLQDARSSAQAWKTQAGEALARVKSLEGEVQRQSGLLTDARRLVEKVQGADSDRTKLREQLASNQRELMLAREHLMAIEVKLDILEGAANVLDARTRIAISQSAKTNTAV